MHIDHLNFDGFYLTIIAWFNLIGNYWQTPNEIMTNQGKNKIRNHTNTGISFNFIHCMADIFGWDGENWLLLYQS